jgi:hypothetical protein
LKDKEYIHDSVITWNKNICDEIRSKLKEDKMSLKRYKIFVHCLIGQKKGQGIRVGSKCLWDNNSDSAVWASYENEHLWAFCSTYGVYFY